MADSLRGHFLIAGPRLRDPNFFKTAVLIIEHGDDGAMGLVVNRPSSVSVANALSGHFDLPQTDDVVFVGGPVEPNALFIVHNSIELSDGECPILPGSVRRNRLRRVCRGDSTRTLRRRGRSAVPGLLRLCRLGTRSTGGELDRGDWYTFPADMEFLFKNDPYCVWDDLLGQVHQSHRILPHTTTNPEWN